MAGEKISLKYSELNLTEILVAVEIRDLKKSQIQHRCISWIRNPKNGQEWNLDVFEKNLCVCTLDDCLLTADEWNKWRRCTWTVQLVSGSAFLLCGWRRGSYWYFPHGIFSLFAPPPIHHPRCYPIGKYWFVFIQSVPPNRVIRRPLLQPANSSILRPNHTQ